MNTDSFIDINVRSFRDLWTAMRAGGGLSGVLRALFSPPSEVKLEAPEVAAVK